MRKKSKYIRKSDVVTVWQCPDCKRFYHVKVSDMAECGTPVCDCEECDCDLCFSHVLVKRPPLKRTLVMGHASSMLTAPGFYETVGREVVSRPEEFGLHSKCRYVNFPQKID